jgi:hypothetical protein
MQNLHPELLTELAHSHIDEAVRAASRRSAVGASRAVPRRVRWRGGRSPRHQSPV